MAGMGRLGRRLPSPGLVRRMDIDILVDRLGIPTDTGCRLRPQAGPGSGHLSAIRPPTVWTRSII